MLSFNNTPRAEARIKIIHRRIYSRKIRLRSAAKNLSSRHASDRRAIRNWLNTGLGFLYPEVCQLCEIERATAKDGFVGAKCWTQVRFIRPPFCERCGLPFEGDMTTTI